VLAFVSTIHLGLLVLRKHRLPGGVFPWALLPSVLIGASPWLFPSAAALAFGMALHLVWFVACERLIPSPGPAAPAAEATGRGAAAAVPGRRPPTAATPAPASNGFTPVSVLAVIEESPTIRTFRLARPAPFTFQAGQFLTVCVQADGQPHVRCYSISSAPESPGCMEISVKRQGLVSGTLHATLRPGSQLLVKPPAGRFTYPAGDDRPIVLIAGGVGITPLISMLRHGVAADPGRPITLLYSARGRRELAFWEELGWTARRHPQVRVVGTVTESSQDWEDRVGRIDRALISNYVPSAAHSVFLMCGPAGMIASIRESLLGLGVPEPQIRSEVFQAAAAIGAVAPPGPDGTVACEAAAAPDGDSMRLELTRSGRTTGVAGHQTLLDAAEAAGADIATLCRAGVCGTCRTRLVSGSVRCTSDALDERDRRAGYVLPCVTWAQSDCALEA
jgi:ferredoxin-NADP reductase